MDVDDIKVSTMVKVGKYCKWYEQVARSRTFLRFSCRLKLSRPIVQPQVAGVKLLCPLVSYKKFNEFCLLICRDLLEKTSQILVFINITRTQIDNDNYAR